MPSSHDLHPHPNNHVLDSLSTQMDSAIAAVAAAAVIGGTECSTALFVAVCCLGC